MNIQLNADKNLTIHAEYENQIVEQLTKGLARFSEHISSLQVHLSDENGDKEGQNDKKCLLEAHFEGRSAVIGSTLANTYDQAITGALTKLKNALNTVDSKLKSHY
jgi:ribosome-associated translation inhibitor RaiA